MDNFSWRCPFCGQVTTITESDIGIFSDDLGIISKYGNLRFRTSTIVCPNPECKEIEVTQTIVQYKYKGQYGREYNEVPMYEQTIIPTHLCKQYPHFIPEAIRSDYEEASKILKLSPKASATISRRCIQGMIRDFFGVVERTLFDEINKIKDKVDPLIWEAIDSTRSIGNIGAHMERDINTIIDVDENEALLLINLIEMLIEEWYILRHEKEKKLRKIKEVAEIKKELKKKPSTTAEVKVGG